MPENMRLNLAITATALGLLAGVVVWALQPDYRAFSWALAVEREYVVGLVPGQVVSEPGAPPPVSLLEYEAALAALEDSIEGEYRAYASMGSMGRRAELDDGSSHPLFHESYVTPGYFEARRVGAQHGRLFEAGAPGEVVLGNRLARTLFGEPSEAVGRKILIGSAGRSESVQVVGVLGPSPAQDSDVDIDDGLAGNLASYARTNGPLMERLPLFLNVAFESPAEAERLAPAFEAWARDWFGPQGSFLSTAAIEDGSRGNLEATTQRIGARRATFIAFGLTLTIAALCALYAQSYFRLLRQRQLLGVEKALGATRGQLAWRLAFAQTPWGAVGGLLAAAGLFALHEFFPDLFLTPPPGAALAAALTLPVVALLLLSSVVSVPLLRQSPMALLRGPVKGSRVRPILALVYLGLALALAGGLAGGQVYTQVRGEIEQLASQFGAMHSLQTGGAIIDTRLERSFEGGGLDPVFTTTDAQALEALTGVMAAVVSQPLPTLDVRAGDERLDLRTTAAGAGYHRFMGLTLATGTTEGCTVSDSAARREGIGAGSVLTLEGLTGPQPCTVTGIVEDPHELWPWLVVDLPELITPAMDGLGLPLPGQTGEPFRSIRVLLALETPEAVAAVEEWMSANRSDVNAELIPYTPDVEQLLENLTVQARLFLLIALVAAALSIWGIVAGFLSLLEAERFKIALDRALGLTVRRMTTQWWSRTLGLGLVSVALGVGLAQLMTVRLYNALALDVANLPGRNALSLDATFLIGSLAMLLLLSTALTFLSAHWLKRRSTLSQLKEGA